MGTLLSLVLGSATHIPRDLKHADKHERHDFKDCQGLDQVAGPLTCWSPLTGRGPGTERRHQDHRLLHLQPVDVSAMQSNLQTSYFFCFFLLLLLNLQSFLNCLYPCCPQVVCVCFTGKALCTPV